MKKIGKQRRTRIPTYVAVICVLHAALICASAYGVHLAMQPGLAGLDQIALLAGAAGFGLLPLLVLAGATSKGLGFDLNKSPLVSRGVGIALKYVPAMGGVGMLLRFLSPPSDSPPASYMLSGGIVLSLVTGIGLVIAWLFPGGRGGWH